MIWPGSSAVNVMDSSYNISAGSNRGARRDAYAGKTVSARDFNYSPDLDYLENDFIVPGPGAQEGFRTVFESLPRPHPSSEIIDFVRVIPSGLVLRLGDQLRVTF